jgi:hypothetical protein
MDANTIRERVPVKPGNIIEAHTDGAELGIVHRITRRQLAAWAHLLDGELEVSRFLVACIASGRACLMHVHEDGAYLREIEAS